MSGQGFFWEEWINWASPDQGTVVAVEDLWHTRKEFPSIQPRYLDRMNEINQIATRARSAMSSPLFVSLFCATASLMTLYKSLELNRSESMRSSLSSSHESELEKMHSEGYESGYQSAIVDAYVESPRYLIEEKMSGRPVMWKRVDLEGPNREILDAYEQSREN